MKGTLKVVLPIALLVAGSLTAVTLIKSRDQPEQQAIVAAPPLVRVRTIELREVRMTVESQGTVSPRTESVLVPEVSGRLIEISPSFVSGGFFDVNAVLMRIDPADYRQAVSQAESRVAQANLRVALEAAEQKVALEEWADLGGDTAAPPLTGREFQVAEAEAGLGAARAALERAERDLARTEIRAPYTGRVREKRVDLGQFVTRGTPVGTIYAVDRAEIRLPLPDEDLAFVDLPLVYRDEREARSGPEVILRAHFAGARHEWRGRVVRAEGEIDPQSRMVHVVAEVDDPYGRAAPGRPDRPPLAAGLYVEAEILGDTIDNAAVIPRLALREGDQVLVVDRDSRLRFRSVDVIRRSGDEVVVAAGLSDGELLCVSPLSAVTEGMLVTTRFESDRDGGDAR